MSLFPLISFCKFTCSNYPVAYWELSLESVEQTRRLCGDGCEDLIVDKDGSVYLSSY